MLRINRGFGSLIAILLIGLLVTSIAVLSSYLKKDGVSFDIREKAVYETPTTTPSPNPGWSVSVSPSECIPRIGSNRCIVYVTWNITGSKNPKVTFVLPNSPARVWSYAPAGSNNPFTLRSDLPNRDQVIFKIYDGNQWIMDAFAEIP